MEIDICEDPENCERLQTIPIKYFENYFISSQGDIFRSGKKLKPVNRTHGYLGISLYKYGTKFNYLIHLLVLKSFIGDKPEGYECNHKNGIKSDNRIENLEWVSRSKNMKHAVENGLVKILNSGKFGQEHPRSKLKSNEVWLIKRLLSTKKITNQFLSKMFLVHPNTIYRIKNNLNWQHVYYNPYICINPENCDETHNEQEPDSDEIHHTGCSCSWCMHVYWTLKH